ncbi:MAG: 50S ribosomal protein L10 [Actinomycetota bacterium]
MAKPEKVEAVKEIADRFSGADAALLTEYRGLSVKEMAEVRGALRDADAEYRVLKNTLTRIAVRDVGLDELVGMLDGPTAIAFCSGDAVQAAKALDDAIKRFPVLAFKGGVLRGRVIDAAQASALAKLEPREVQLATIAMMVNTPLQQTVNVFAALLRDLGSMLAQVVAQKESSEPPPPADVAEASEETLESPEVGPAPQTEPEETPVAEAQQESEEPEQSKDKEE